MVVMVAILFFPQSHQPAAAVVVVVQPMLVKMVDQVVEVVPIPDSLQEERERQAQCKALMAVWVFHFKSELELAAVVVLVKQEILTVKVTEAMA